MKTQKLTIAMFGSYPPPYGGVAIHIQRLRAMLVKNCIECIIYDISNYTKKDKKIININKIYNWYHVFIPKGDIVHIHKSYINLKHIIFFIILYRVMGKKVVLTYHGRRYDVKNFNWFKRMITKATADFISHYIVVGPHIKDKLLFLNVNPNKISIIPAFLPPVIKNEEIDEIPQRIFDFMEHHTPLISANAYRISFYNNQDLYGIDMCVELCNNLKKKYPKIGLILCLPYIGDLNYFNIIQNKIKDYGIKNNFLFITQPYQFYPILMNSDIFVRPTNTDGDAVSIREALYFRVPVVTSDIVPRPEEVILFKNRDINDFTLKVKDILNNYEWHKKILEEVKLEDNYKKIIEVYNKVNGYERRR